MRLPVCAAAYPELLPGVGNGDLVHQRVVIIVIEGQGHLPDTVVKVRGVGSGEHGEEELVVGLLIRVCGVGVGRAVRVGGPDSLHRVPQADAPPGGEALKIPGSDAAQGHDAPGGIKTEGGTGAAVLAVPLGGVVNSVFIRVGGGGGVGGAEEEGPRRTHGVPRPVDGEGEVGGLRALSG